MAVGAVVVQAVGLTHKGTSYPMFIALVACSALALLAFAAGGLQRRRTTALAPAAR